MDWVEEWSAGWNDEPSQLDIASLVPLLRVARLGVLIDRFRSDVLASFELTPREFDVLGALREAGGPRPVNPSQLYGPLRLSSGGTTKILKRLEETGQIERAPDPEDGRGVRIVLTNRGVALHDRVLRAFAAASTRLLEDLSPSEKDEIDATLLKLLGRLDVTQDVP